MEEIRTDSLNAENEPTPVERIIFGRVPNYISGVQWFGELSLEKLLTLVDAKLIHPEDSYNDSPTVGDYIDFMQKHKGFVAHGYVVPPERGNDVVIEGLAYDGEADRDTLIDFANTFHWADEFEMQPDYLRCWYD